MASVDAAAYSPTASADPALIAAAPPPASASVPVVTPAAAAASPLTSLLSPMVGSFLPVAKAKSVIDAIDIFLAAHPWAAPASYVALTWALQNGIGTAHTTVNGDFVAGAAPHHIKMLALGIFAGALIGLKAVHSGGLQFIPNALQFLIGGNGAGLGGMLPLLSRFYYVSQISYPIIAMLVITFLPNSTPVISALMSAGLMLLPLMIALAKKLAGATPETTAASKQA